MRHSRAEGAFEREFTLSEGSITPGPNCIPLLTCQLHQGLIAHGEHLTHRCQGWTDDMVRQRGWAPEVA